MKGVKRTEFENGLVLLTAKIPRAKKAVILVGVKVGSVDEDDKLNGGSHFNEHLLFKSNTHRTAKQITETLELGGAAINAWTGFDQTVFYVKCLSKSLTEAVIVAHEAATNFHYDEKEFERERQVILTEIKLSIENPSNYAASHLFYPTLFADTPLQRTIAGTEKSMGTVTASDLLRFKSDYYAPNNMIIVVAGNFDEKELKRIVKKTFGSLPFVRGIHHKQITALPNRRCEKLEPRAGLKQPYLYLGYRVPNGKHQDTFKLWLLDSVFSGGFSSRLFQELREKRGIGYSVSSFYSDFVGIGIFGVYVGGLDANRFVETREVILGQFADLKTNLVSDKEFDIARNLLISQHNDRMESVVTIAKFILQKEIDNDHYDLWKTEKDIKKVTKEDIQKMARQHLTDDYTLTALVPEDFKIS